MQFAIVTDAGWGHCILRYHFAHIQAEQQTWLMMIMMMILRRASFTSVETPTPLELTLTRAALRGQILLFKDFRDNWITNHDYFYIF